VTETKYKAKTKAEAENLEALDYSKVLGTIRVQQNRRINLIFFAFARKTGYPGRSVEGRLNLKGSVWVQRVIKRSV